MSRQGAPARADTRIRLEMLRWMTLARRLGEKIETDIRRIGGVSSGDTPEGLEALFADSAPAGSGLEAVSVGACLNARASDLVAPAPGDVAAFLLRGVAAERIVGHYAGRSAGPSRGRDGGGRIGDMALGLIAPVTRAASSVAVAAGAALAFKHEGQGRLVLCLFHEQAVWRGDWHEGMNFAAVQKLPVVYVCATVDHGEKAGTDGPDALRVSDRAVAYGIPGIAVDGADVLDVYDAVADAAARARRGEGPSIIEGRIDSLSPPRGAGDASEHARGTSGRVRRDAVSAELDRPDRPFGRDPLARLARELVRAGHAAEDAIAEIEVWARRAVDDAFAGAAALDVPSVEECLQGVTREAAP